MTEKSTHNAKLADRLLDWNRRNLRHDSVLSSDLIAECFAPQFTVFANGRRYAAEHGNYQEFLESFKSTISTIDYRVDHTVATEESIVLALRAKVLRTYNCIDDFDAMLLLQFDSDDKVTLWHEVYFKTSTHPFNQ
ncbi:hypothetical protein FNU76_07290 [Chitinimonas arctica]|uniref:Nuclear transport factor 2 family protein n=1 Tax=Chitinimonas arctica TaxID=2594795 RepID=A0A516SDE2_9NEIS|nr:hypothetical protein [Chitinimonas arctica]QDQ26177.1 hypothetical protein FNU76_07290 [Chitinimonas arctica]